MAQKTFHCTTMTTAVEALAAEILTYWIISYLNSFY